LGDLVTDITVTQSTATSFNFNTSAVVGSSVTPKVIKGLIQTKKKSRDSLTNTTSILFESSDIEDPSIYDTFIINGVIWTGVPPYTNNGYLITIDVTKEG
jgi:hypothetical protein